MPFNSTLCIIQYCSLLLMKPQTVGKKYKILKTISCLDGFINLHPGVNTKTNLQVAIKLERVNTQHPNLIYQCKLYLHLHNDQTVIDKGIPNVYYCSTQGDYNVLVMDLLGPSLENLFNRTNRKFSLKTVLMLIDQIISRVQYIHSRDFIHRDIGPDHFCCRIYNFPFGSQFRIFYDLFCAIELEIFGVGLNKTSNKIFITNFSWAKRYIKRDGTHIPYIQGKRLIGTPRYTSINSHLGNEQGCRDDLESIGYVAMYFLRGNLPWQGLKAYNKSDKYERIKEMKLKTSIEDLCKGYSVEFTQYLNICKNLKFDEKPKYEGMRNMFKYLFQRKDYQYDYQYDWVILADIQEDMKNKKQKVRRILKLA